MIEWYKRLGNEICILNPVDHLTFEKHIGIVESYDDKSNTIQIIEDGIHYQFNMNYVFFNKTENTLPNMIQNYEHLRELTKDQIVDFIFAMRHSPMSIEDIDEWMSREYCDENMIWEIKHTN